MSRVLESDITIPFKWTCGNIYGKFLAGLKDKKIYGVKCPICKKVYAPPQDVCPQCFEDFGESDFVEVKDEGKLISYTQILKNFFGKKPTDEYLQKRILPAKLSEHPLLWFPEPPYAILIINLEGSDTGFLHIAKGEDLDKLQVGSKLKAVWKENGEGYIFDIERFEVI